MPADKFYVPGSWYRICDRTGFKVRSYNTRMQWNNIIVRSDVWEPRQPQDFVTGVPDNETVPMARPRSVDSYDGPLHTFVTVAASIGDFIINVNETARMYPGDNIELALDAGGPSALLQTFILQVIGSSQLRLNDKLPWTAAVNNDLTNISAISPPNPGTNSFGQYE